MDHRRRRGGGGDRRPGDAAAAAGRLPPHDGSNGTEHSAHHGHFRTGFREIVQLSNAVSSRSHAIFIVSIVRQIEQGVFKRSQLYLADLAGSEKVAKTGADGDRLNEAKSINQSLLALGKVNLTLAAHCLHICLLSTSVIVARACERRKHRSFQRLQVMKRGAEHSHMCHIETQN